MVYHVKGGIWKNTEDEILKAAVMKYGLNQWARISSLLVRKSASQCKSRWYEWLDPSIKKTEWSREEEEKLLHLAKILPNQWRTIAPLVGRTANQCLEHYEKLLDMAQQRDEDYDPADDPRRLRPGEIDPNPEVKPARPDPIDMDEDEKEMLQEARARLANTKGKKAKRKAREKQLDEAKRIATLQKRRELKAAGINISLSRRKKKKGEMDYRREIPFHQEAPAGFFEPEDNLDIKLKTFRPTELAKLEGKRKFVEEQKERERDAKRQKTRKEENLPAVIMQVNKLNDPQQIRRQNPLQLPAPQMTENELEELAKFRKTTGDEEDEDTVTSALLSNYRETPTPMHTPARGAPIRTPVRQDSVLKEAQNLIALSTGATPLVGGENTPLHKSDFTGATPSKSSVATPNVLATPLRTPAGHLPGSTPVRDQLNINAGGDQQIQIYEEKFRQTAQAKQLDSLFSSLPKPKMTYNFVLPEEDTSEDAQSTQTVEDQAEVEARKQKQREEEQEKLFRSCSAVLQRSLPRCMMVPKSPSSVSTPEELIQQELRSIVLHDQFYFPSKALKSAPTTKPSFDILPEKCLNEAKELVEQEIQAVLKEQNLDEDLLVEQFIKAWDEAHDMSSALFSTSTNRFVDTKSMKKAEQLAALESQFEFLRGRVTKEAGKAKKLEKKISVYNAGYESKCTGLQKEIGQLYLDYELAQTELNCFLPLQAKEQYSIQRRIGELTKLVDIQNNREAELQKRYEALTNHAKKLAASS